MSRPEDFPPPSLPDPERLVIDDDIFHPLDHRIGSPYCRSFQAAPRAVRLHWQYQWQFGPWRDHFAWWHRLTGCLIGHHGYRTWWRRVDDEMVFGGRSCEWCSREDPDLITHERIE